MHHYNVLLWMYPENVPMGQAYSIMVGRNLDHVVIMKSLSAPKLHRGSIAQGCLQRLLSRLVLRCSCRECTSRPGVSPLQLLEGGGAWTCWWPLPPPS